MDKDQFDLYHGKAKETIASMAPFNPATFEMQLVPEAERNAVTGGYEKATFYSMDLPGREAYKVKIKGVLTVRLQRTVPSE